MGSDGWIWPFPSLRRYFNPRSPHGERQALGVGADVYYAFQSTPPAWGATRFAGSLSLQWSFQSTLPAWGATHDGHVDVQAIDHFNPRSPHGERPAQPAAAKHREDISIHAPRMGSDTVLPAQGSPPRPISIHAPRMGSDARRRAGCPCLLNFNPRSPHGERQQFSPKQMRPFWRKLRVGWGVEGDFWGKGRLGGVGSGKKRRYGSHLACEPPGEFPCA